MRVVGIDQSYTGFGYSVDGESKKKAFPISKFDGDGHRLIEMRSWFMQWLALQQTSSIIDLVVMEGYANATKFGREQAGELGGMVKMAVFDVTKTHPLVVPPTSLKKFVTGSGAAKKNEMLLGVYKRWGVEFRDDNQADAFSLEKFGHGYLAMVLNRPAPRGHEVGYTKYQIEAIEKVRSLVP